jgi:dTDP-glucose 4,6-dehydratase
MKILVTGGGGFIGSNLVYKLLDKTDYEIILIDKFSYASNPEFINELKIKSNRLTVINSTIDNESILESVNCDVIINLAAETHVTRSLNDSRNFLVNDIIATDTLLKTSLKNKKLKKFIHISTSEVYGTNSLRSIEMKENHPLNPSSPYASSKCGADRLVYSYGKTYDFPFTIIRPFNNYGPRQHLEKLIPRFICSILNKKTLTIHGNGKASRDYIYVEDTCDALLKVINTKKKIYHEVFNLGCEKDYSILDVANILFSISKCRINKKHIEHRPGQVGQHLCNSIKFRKFFNWKPKVSFKEGLAKTFAWYKDNKDWWSKRLDLEKVRVVMPDGKIFYH